MRVRFNPRFEEIELIFLPLLAPDWWERLVALQTIRISLKKRRPVGCPFRKIDEWRCDEHCRIRQFIETSRRVTDLIIPSDATCQIGNTATLELP
jgi:hypothetical protein